MKKACFLLIALMLSMAISAQTRIHKVDASTETFVLNTDVNILTPKGKQNAKTPQHKITLNEGERVMGFYTTDELPDFTNGGIGLKSSVNVSVGNNFDEEVIGNFVGGSIMRFRFSVAYNTTVNNAFIHTYTIGEQDTLYIEPVTLVGINTVLTPGWYEVELPEPITIEEGVKYLIGFDYRQINGTYPIATDGTLERNIERDYFYYCTATNSTWKSLSDYGALCLQAVVKGGNFLDDDLALNKLSVPKYASQNDGLAYSFQIRNIGNKYPESYTLKISIDGEEKEILDNPIAVTTDYQTISGTMDISSVSVGSHTISIAVDKINGVTPTEDISDDVVEASFTVYDGNSVTRQMHLLENFTSIYCGYCPEGHVVLEALQEDYPDKYAWVALHGLGMGDDTLAIKSDERLVVEQFLGVGSYPTASIDRTGLSNNDLGLSDDYVFSIGYDSQYAHRIAGDIDEAIEVAFDGVPALVSVDITPRYDFDTRELTIIVSGEGSTSAKQLLSDNRLTIYLTEDGIEGLQEDYYNGSSRNGYLIDYVHNHVLRAIVNEYEWGDDINWTSEASYENTITITLDDKWDYDQLYVVAFISGSMEELQDDQWVYNNIADGMVNNVNCVKAVDVPEGISAVTVSSDDKTPSYYTIDGRQISTPGKGVNIIRYTDGTVKKIYVK